MFFAEFIKSETKTILHLLLQACSFAKYQVFYFLMWVSREVAAQHSISDVRIPAKEAIGYSGMLLIIYQAALSHFLQTNHLQRHMKSSTVKPKMNLALHPSRCPESV